MSTINRIGVSLIDDAGCGQYFEQLYGVFREEKQNGIEKIVCNCVVFYPRNCCKDIVVVGFINKNKLITSYYFLSMKTRNNKVLTG